MSIVRIPPTLRDEAGGERQVPAEGETVRELLDDLVTASRRSARGSSTTTGSRRSSTSTSRARTCARARASTRRSARLDGDPAAGHGRRLHTPVQELYELWAGDSELSDALGQSLEPRGTDWLFEVFAALGPQPGELVLDVGARDAVHAIRLVREHGLRAVALDPVPLHCELRASGRRRGARRPDRRRRGRDRELPFDDASVDWIWCRDVLVHVDAERGLAECARVLRPGGALVAYVTLATERLEPREAAEARRRARARAESFDADRIEAAAAAAGLVARAVERLGSRVARADDRGRRRGTRPTTCSSVARLRRRAPSSSSASARRRSTPPGAAPWGVYQLLGKLCPTVYVWERRA